MRHRCRSRNAGGKRSSPASSDAADGRRGSWSRSRQYDDRGLRSVYRPHGLHLGLSPGQCTQPPRVVCYGTRARLLRRCRAHCPGGLQHDVERLRQARPDVHRMSQPRCRVWAGFTDLDKEPTVIQVPDFGDRFYVYGLYDQRTDEIARIGKQYGTRPGFYLIAGQNWKGAVPPGITAVVRSSTDLVFVVPRIFKDDTPEDTKAVQPLISQVMMYPLSKFDGKMKTTDYSKLPHFPVP